MESEIDRTMATPLYTFDYFGKNIETYSTYSIIDGQVSTNFLYYVKSGNLIIVDKALSPVADGIFAYYYEGNSYIGVLNTEGKIVSLGTVNIPASLQGFKNDEIYSLASNINSDSSTFTVTYTNGSTVGYNVVTGEEVFRTGESEKTGIGEYLMDYVRGIFSEIGQRSYSSSRQSADNLIKQLEISQYSISDLASAGVLDSTDSLEQFLETGEIGEDVKGDSDSENQSKTESSEIASEVPVGQEEELVYDSQTGTYIKLSDVTHHYDTTVYDGPVSTEQAEGITGEAWVTDTTKPLSEQSGSVNKDGHSTANGKNDSKTDSKALSERNPNGKTDGEVELEGDVASTEIDRKNSDGKSEKAGTQGDGKVSISVTEEGADSGGEKSDRTADASEGGNAESEERGKGEPGEVVAETEPHQSVMQGSESEEYVAVYNPESESYDIYSVSELMENPDGAESETAKINSDQVDALMKMLSASEDHTEGRGFNFYSVIVGIVLVLLVVSGFVLKRARKEVHYEDQDDGFIQ